MPKTVGTHDGESGSSRPKRTRVHETVEEAMLLHAIEDMLEIKVYAMGGQEEIFTSEAWRRAYDINEPIYTELCHEFYSTYEFDEVEICEEGFEVYFQGGLISDEHFNARDYWLSISSEDKLHLSRSATHTIRRPNLRYANVTWLIAKWLKRKGVGFQRESMICCGQFITMMARKMSLLTDEVLDGLSALIYYRSLDATTLRELIDSNERLIAEDPTPGVPIVAMPRPPHPTMQVLYERVGSMKICQGVLERISYRQSYHSDRYARVFEYMVRQYNIPLQVAYAPLDHDEEQQQAE
ncbi:hypothetical protein Tco_0780577 [Tanacetum coccineum]